MIKIYRFILSSILTFGLLVGVSSAAEKSPIKIGAVEPLTGWAAAEGNYVIQGAQIAVDQINAKGGINGRKLKLIAEDGKNEPMESLNAAQKLINRDKVSVMFGCWLATATLSVIPAIVEAQIPLINETSGLRKITHPLNPWVFRTAILFAQEAASVENCLLDVGFTKVAFLAQDNDWGRGTVEQFSKMLHKIGGEVVSVEYIDAATTDFYPQLTKTKNSDADSIIVVNSTHAVSKLLQQAYELGLKQKILSTGGSVWPYTVIRLAGAEASEGSYTLSFFPAFAPEVVPNPAAAKSYVADWKKRGLTWDGVQEGARGYDVIYTIAEGIKNAGGSSDPAKIREGLEKVDIKGITGHIVFDKFHDQQPKISIVQVKDGTPRIIECK